MSPFLRAVPFLVVVVVLLLVVSSTRAQLPPCEPLTVSTFASPESCASGERPVARGTVVTDGLCRSTRVLFDDDGAESSSSLPGVYAATCRFDDDSVREIGSVAFAHSACSSDTCALDERGLGAPRCAQYWNALGAYYARLTGRIPVTSPDDRRRCLGFTVGGGVALAFTVTGSCNCVHDDGDPPTASPGAAPTTAAPVTPRPTTRAPVTRTPPPQVMPSPPTTSPSTPRPTPRPTRTPTGFPTISPTTPAPTTPLPTSVAPTVVLPVVDTNPTSPTAPSSPTTTAVPTGATASQPIGLVDSFTASPAFTHTPTTGASVAVSLDDEDGKDEDTTGRDEDNLTNNLNQDGGDDSSTLLLASLAVGAGVLVCCVACCLLWACHRRKRQDKVKTSSSQQHPPLEQQITRDTNELSPTSEQKAMVNEISFHHREEEETSTLGDPIGDGHNMYANAGYAGTVADESTATPLVFARRRMAMEEDDGTIDSIYTSGTDLRVSKDDNSWEEAFGQEEDDNNNNSIDDDENPLLRHVEVPPGPLGLLIQSGTERRGGGGLRVSGFQPDSVFAEEDVRIGDALVAVDRVDVRHLTPAALSALVQARVHSSRLFSFQRRREDDGGDRDEKDVSDPAVRHHDDNRHHHLPSDGGNGLSTVAEDMDVWIHC